jgi:RHH-type proline utilization regulon transcriptional repressor/proline dehydrogenase/delta 1-pyrroline-5-carboxylate dehydrogenase
MKASPMDADRVVELAAELLRQAVLLQTPQERRQQAELDRMIGHAQDKATLVEMTDQAFRTHTPARVADQLTHLLDVQGVPRFFSPVEQAMLRGFQSFGEYLPGVAVPLVKEKMRRETANVILPAEPELLCEHLRNRQSQGVQMNVNLLGEALLGEEETRRRMQDFFDTLRLPEVRCLSVKITTLYSQVSPLARKHTISKVADRLETLYRTANREIDQESGLGKFVYLDMEEYRDLHLTADVLCEALDRPGLELTRAGIALQAYIPDSFQVMSRLIDWSCQRVSRGSTPLTIRLVKGANLEMERVEASIGGHPQAPYLEKLHTDANYKRMLRRLMESAAKNHVRAGVASHNLFDVALALVWAQAEGVTENMQIEMLEGMANHQRRAISARNADMLLYSPACRREGFLNAIGYLIRRLDENTGPQNFLRHAYRLQPDSPEFEKLAGDFRRALDLSDTVDDSPRRKQDRRQPPAQPPAGDAWSEFVNEPDTDWSLPHNADWAASVLAGWQAKSGDAATEVPLMIGSRCAEGEWREAHDPSRPGVLVCRYQVASLEQVNEAVSLAHDDTADWQHSAPSHRHDLLRGAAQRLREQRGELIGAMAAEGGKTVAESDPEVSEAIDFCEFYPLTTAHWNQHPGLQSRPRGVVAVITPWNFPLAIPCGGIAAALAAGNTVVLKPAAETVMTAGMLCHAFWDAGVPRSVLQMIPCDDHVAEAGLVANSTVSTVILTGGTSTAKRMLAVRPDLHLLAETGGKNATIVTAMADRELAIKHVVQSAFGHSGQKCSATSLLLLEDEVFRDEKFKTTLADAVRSLKVGSAWQLPTRIGPLIAPPGVDLSRGLKTLEDDESWLVVPEHVVDNPNLYRPGVKWNIRPGGFTHLTELFGPVLGVMPFSRLEEAIEIVRSTGYGLTSGLESLDEREIALWKQSIGAGNLYINRPTTGAIVLRQPFGGVGLSAYGPGVKAGGPHYLLTLMHLSQSASFKRPTPESSDVEHAELDSLTDWRQAYQSRMDPAVHDGLAQAMESQRLAFAEEFSREHDTVRLVGQDNLRRYRPVRSMTVRFGSETAMQDGLIALSAAIAVVAQVTLSIEPRVDEETKGLLESIADFVPGHVHPVEETDAQLAERISQGHVNRLRLPGSGNEAIIAACAAAFVTVVSDSVLVDGRIECLRYMDEQSISHDYHRYGNLGRRADEARREVL